jgi:hypothetical protein
MMPPEMVYTDGGGFCSFGHVALLTLHNYGNDLQTLEDMWLEKLQPSGAKGYHKKKT